VSIIEPRQGLKFPGIEYIKDKVMKHGPYEDPPHAVILNMTHFSGCDHSMVMGITQIVEYFNKHDLLLVLACAPVCMWLRNGLKHPTVAMLSENWHRSVHPHQEKYMYRTWCNTCIVCPSTTPEHM